jgi:hypothetical protein
MEEITMLKPLFKGVIFLMLLGIMFGGCGENEPTKPEMAQVPVETIIMAGPADGETMVWGATATFTWKGEVYPGDIIAFEYTFVSIVAGDTTTVTASALQRSISYSDLGEGSYSFSVAATAVADQDTVVDSTPAIRSFTVIAAENTPPSVTITDGPKEKSFAATNADVFLSWAGTPQSGRKLSGYAFRLNGNTEGTWSDVSLVYTNTAFYNLANAKYTFQIKAVDNAGQETIVERKFEVKDPDVLFAIEPGLTAIDVAYWHTNALRDFSYEDYYVADAASFIAKLDANVYSTVVWAWKNGYSATLDSANFSDVTVAGTVAKAVYDYEQAGGHLWIAGSEVMWGLDDVGAVVSGASAFATQLLHCDSYDEGDHNFQGANSAGVGSYNSIIVDGNATFNWCDQVNPTADAETILTFSSGDFIDQPAAIRYPAGAANPGDVKVVFFGFYITDSTQPAACKTSDIYELATTILTDLGENEDW